MKGNTITATLIPEHIRFLETHTKETGINKNKIIKKALDSFIIEVEKQKFKAEFDKFKTDNEYKNDMKEWAKWGMKEYSQQLKKVESK